MVQAEELYETLHRKPFQPFRLHLVDGQTVDIRQRWNNVVGETFFAHGVPSQEDPEIARRTMTIPMDQIESVEMLVEAGSAQPV